VKKTPEELINRAIDNYIEGGWGDVFQIFHANHGHYPEHAELAQAAEEYREVGRRGERSVDLGSMNPDLYGKKLSREQSNAKLDFYLEELEKELNVLLKVVGDGDDAISEGVKRIAFIFHRVKESREEVDGGPILGKLSDMH